MRFQRDYILRMIEMMGELFRRIGDMLDDFEKLNELDKVSKKHCGMSIDAALALDTNALSDFLAPYSRLILSDLLYIRVRTITRLSSEETNQLVKYAVELLSSLWDNSVICEQRGQRLSELLNEYDLQMSADSHLNAARFFASAELLDKAEDEVFYAVNSASEKHTYIAEGKALFYQIAKLSDDKLLFGQLPRAELVTAIADLTNLENAI